MSLSFGVTGTLPRAVGQGLLAEGGSWQAQPFGDSFRFHGFAVDTALLDESFLVSQGPIHPTFAAIGFDTSGAFMAQIIRNDTGFVLASYVSPTFGSNGG
jgi:hypothetical protein